MLAGMFSYEITCGNCGWRSVCGPVDAAARLRLVGLLRREPDPGDDVLAALFVETAPRMTCPTCKEKRLRAAPAADADDGDWPAAVLCDVCRRPISAERLEAVPGTRRCASCQGLVESGQTVDEPEYCPHCGAMVDIRVSRGGGMTRFKRVCTGDPPCRL
jgi:hypothetical protein